MPTAGLDPPDHVEPFDAKARPFVAVPTINDELGWKDPVMQAGRWRLWRYFIRENDPYYYDPTVTNSVVGPGGTDMQRTPELLDREIPGRMTHEEWRDRRYFLDPNVKAIYEKYPISKHHPGLHFRPTGLDYHHEDITYYGGLLPTLGLLRNWPGIMPSNWKFMAAPFGEDCHVKTAVAIKTGLFFGTGFFVYVATMFGIGRGWRWMLKKCIHYNSYTVPVAAGWAAASCISCSIRKKDDWKNMVPGGIAVGSLIGMKSTFFHGYNASILASLLGIIWYYVIAHEQGLFAKPASYEEQRPISWDPNSEKWIHWESGMFDPLPPNF